MKRILLDQGLPATAAVILREQGWDARHAREVELHMDADAAILAYARADSRTVITLDRDFPQILALVGATRPSVVPIRQQRLRAPDLVHLLTAIWLDHETELERGCVLTVGARGTRFRPLPLK